jgi:hypothetical protein
MVADITGFTKLTEILSKQGSTGVELLTNCINDYFGKVCMHVLTGCCKPMHVGTRADVYVDMSKDKTTTLAHSMNRVRPFIVESPDACATAVPCIECSIMSIDEVFVLRSYRRSHLRFQMHLGENQQMCRMP